MKNMKIDGVEKWKISNFSRRVKKGENVHKNEENVHYFREMSKRARTYISYLLLECLPNVRTPNRFKYTWQVARPLVNRIGHHCPSKWWTFSRGSGLHAKRRIREASKVHKISQFHTLRNRKINKK